MPINRRIPSASACHRGGGHRGVGTPTPSGRPATVRVGVPARHWPRTPISGPASCWAPFAAQGLELETVQFVTGLEAYQALAGGSVDLVTTGAVISNFPARGQGKAFLINAEEFGTAQLWVHPDSGIKTVADLKGQKIATTRGTTAHYFLLRALQHNGLDPAKDIEIVHQQMGNAVTAFIAGAVPAVATWMPFDGSIAKSAPDAVKIADASQFADAAILNGWSARNELHASDPELLRRFVRAWLPANEALATRPQEILTTLQPIRYREFTPAQLQSQYDACHWRPAAEWASRYRDGSVAQILDQVTASTSRSAPSPIRCPPQPTSTRARCRTCWRRVEHGRDHRDARHRTVEPARRAGRPACRAPGPGTRCRDHGGRPVRAPAADHGRHDPPRLRRAWRGVLPRPAPDARAAHRLASRFGEINVNRFFRAVDGYPEIAEVRKDAEHKKNIGGDWHTDHSYDEIPALGSILLAHGAARAAATRCSPACMRPMTRSRMA